MTKEELDIEDQPTVEIPKWISRKEALPDKEQRILVCDRDGEQTVIHGYSYINNKFFCRMDAITGV